MISSLAVTDIEFHEAANIFPLDEEHIAELAIDIQKHGQRQPIELLDGKILDGRRRYMACDHAGVEPLMKDVSPADPVAYVLSLNLHRRHLSDTQLAIAGARAIEMYSVQAKERQQVRKGKQGGSTVENLPQLETGKARDKVGKAVGVSGKSIGHGLKVLNDGTPKLIEAVEADKIAVSTAAKIALLPPSQQDEFVERAKGKPTTRKENKVATLSVVDDKLTKSEQESKGVRDEFAANLDKVSDGGVYTIETLADATGITKTSAHWFIRMCEVAPSVKVIRAYGRKGLTQYTLVKTNCVDARTRIRQLAEQIATSVATSSKSCAAAQEILSLLGG